jgi:hypothetical protein
VASDASTLDGLSAVGIRAWNHLLFTPVIVNLRNADVRAPLSTILTFVISVGAISLQMLRESSIHVAHDVTIKVFALFRTGN